MTRKKHLWIPLTLMLLASIAMVNIPVKADPYETRLYIRESPPGEWISAGDVGSTFYVIVDIETPWAWDDTADGIVGWECSVHVDPDVLKPYSLGAYGGGEDYFLYDYLDFHGYANNSAQFLVDEVIPETGDIKRAGENILGFDILGKGAGGDSGTPDHYGEAKGLFRLRFEKLSETAYTPIDLYNAYWVQINASNPDGFSKIPFDEVDDGQFNQVPAYLTVESTPFNNTDFTIDSTTYTTNTTIELQPENYTVTMPASFIRDEDLYGFVEWEDASTNPVRTVSLTSNMTIIATYGYAGPPLEANLKGRSGWREHAHFDVSKHGNESIPDAKGTPGYQTLFAKIMNIGEGNVTVKATFRVYKGDSDITLTTTLQEIEVGQIVVLTVNFAGDDGYPWETVDEGIWRVEVKCWYDQPGVGWLSGVKVKTFKFAVVP